MFAWFNELRRDRRGDAVVEFALALPLMLLLLAGMLDVGRALYQAVAIEKGLRVGALYAARAEAPVSAETTTFATNLVKTGTLAGTGPYLASGWSRPEAALDISTRDYAAAEGPVTVVRLTASVPFDPLLRPLLQRFGIGDFTIRLSHEQAHIGV